MDTNQIPVSGWPLAVQWLTEAKEDVQNAIEALGQVIARIADARDEIVAAPVGRKPFNAWTVGEMTSDLEDMEDEAVRLIAYLKKTPFEDLEGLRPDRIERLKSAAAEANDRARGYR